MGDGRKRWGSPLGYHCLTRCCPRARGILPVRRGEGQVTGMGRGGRAQGQPGFDPEIFGSEEDLVLSLCPYPLPQTGHWTPLGQ